MRKQLTEMSLFGNQIIWVTILIFFIYINNLNLGHFYLTELLLPKLEQSEEGGRIINVSSSLHLYADTVDFEICNSKRYYSWFYLTYARSKLANVNF